MNCCICESNVRCSINIFTDSIGSPAIPISDLVILCTKGTTYKLPENSTICRKCYEKLSCYYKFVQVAKQLRNDVLQLIPALSKEFNTKFSKKRKQTDDSEISSSAQGYSALQQNVEGLTTTEEQQMYVRRESLDIKPDLIILAESSNVPPTNLECLEETHDTYGSIHDEFIAEGDEKCPNCDEIFYDTLKYDVCDRIGKTMISYSEFLGNVQNHETVKQHVCRECGEHFNQKIRLNYHMTKHTGETLHKSMDSRIRKCDTAFIEHQLNKENIDCANCKRLEAKMDHLEESMRNLKAELTAKHELNERNSMQVNASIMAALAEQKVLMTRIVRQETTCETVQNVFPISSDDTLEKLEATIFPENNDYYISAIKKLLRSRVEKNLHFVLHDNIVMNYNIDGTHGKKRLKNFKKFYSALLDSIVCSPVQKDAEHQLRQALQLQKKRHFRKLAVKKNEDKDSAVDDELSSNDAAASRTIF